MIRLRIYFSILDGTATVALLESDGSAINLKFFHIKQGVVQQTRIFNQS